MRMSQDGRCLSASQTMLRASGPFRTPVLGLGVVIAALASQVGACMNSSKQAKTTSPTAVASCPLADVPGVRALVQDTQDGVQIVFAGPEGQIDRVRQNVRAMVVTNNNQGDPFAPCTCAMQSPGAAETMPSTAPLSTLQAAHIIPLSSAEFEQTPTGAILKLSPKDKDQAQSLRVRTREEVGALRNCLTNVI